MLARTHLIQIQKNLYNKLRDYARHYAGGLSPDLKYYLHDYQESLKNYEGLTSNRQLLIDLIKSQIVFFGDYHTLAQSQRTVLRFLNSTQKILKRQKRQTVLCLEMFTSKDQKILDSYLSGRLSEKKLQEKTQFRKKWGFSWENYAPLFRYAKENGVKLVGLDPVRRRTIKERDVFAAEIIAELTEEDPTALIFILIGDLHLAEKHLPKELEKQLKESGEKRETLIIHQNNEKFYWSLVEQGLEGFAEVLKVKNGVYCVMNTPPWVKLQSHLKWIEAVAEGAGPKGQAGDYARAIDSLDHSHEIEEILKILKDFLEIQEPLEDDFHIRGPLDLSFLEEMGMEGIYTKSELKILSQCLSEFDSQFFPRTNDLFLTNLGLNHLTSQSAYFLHSKLSGFQGVFQKPKRDFYTFLWTEALAFFASKLVNPKRKTPSEYELKRALRSARKKGERKTSRTKAIQFVLLHLEKERRMKANGSEKFRLEIKDETPSIETVLIYYKAVKILGHLLGHALYSGLYEGRISRDELRELFHCPFTPFHEPKRLYTRWILRLDQYQYRDLV